jgi:hypothetical protein
MANPVEDRGAAQLRAVTPSDTLDLPAGTCRALWVGGDGDVAVIADRDSSAVTIKGALAGTILPVRTRRVMSTNTTATNIVALY